VDRKAVRSEAPPARRSRRVAGRFGPHKVWQPSRNFIRDQTGVAQFNSASVTSPMASLRLALRAKRARKATVTTLRVGFIKSPAKKRADGQRRVKLLGLGMTMAERRREANGVTERRVTATTRVLQLDLLIDFAKFYGPG